MPEDLERERQQAEEHKSKMDSARDSLYTPGAPSVIHRQPEPAGLPKDEETQPNRVFVPPPVAHTFNTGKTAQKVNVVFRRLLMAAVLFFIVALGAATFMYFYGNNIISSRNIKIDFTAPPSVPSSDSFSFDISVQNGNNSDLIKTAIVIDYPEGTRYVDDNAKSLVSERIDTGTLRKGEIIKRTVSARLFGEENAEKNIKVRLEYEVENSNAHFSKDADFNVILRLAPVVISIDALREVNNNQEVILTARIISNSNNTLRNVALNVIYPFGFNYTRSNLEVDGSKGQFPVGDIQPNETKTVEIRGTINGQSAEEKVFKFNVGTASPEENTKVTTTLATFIHDMIIRGDFLASSIVFNDPESYAYLGVPIRGTILWKNTLPEPINDAKFILKISGDLIDTENISSDRGFYDSNRGLIEWDKNVEKQLEEIAPGQTGSFSFTISLFDYDKALSERISNPKVTLDFDIQGQRITEKNVTENIRSSFTKIVPVVTVVDLTAKSLYNSGPLKNSGPIPPKAENKTTYTVALSLSNSVNAVTNGEVTATLPNYVKYEGGYSPASDKLTWNESTRQIRWNVGTLPVRTGYGTSPRTIYFKVSITPSRTQIGDILNLVNNIVFNGKDVFANGDIKAISPNVTTDLQDPGVVFGNGQVVQ